MKKKLLYITIFYALWLIFLKLPFWQVIDITIAQNIIATRTAFLTSFFTAFTNIASTKIIILLTVILAIFFYFKNKRYSLQLALTLLTSAGLVTILKYTIKRPRPALSQLVTETTASFPSGHSNAIFTLFGFVIYVSFKNITTTFYRWTVITISCLIILLVGYSRLYLGVHWFTDIIAGYSTALYTIILYATLFDNYQLS